MFTVGEFSKIAQVSKRLLRYYDEIGLLPPARIDEPTGRRFYSAGQMPTLNRILALKDLGFSLEEIQQLVQDGVSSDDMESMLLLKKTEIEHLIQSELERIHRIESRLYAIQNADRPLNVVMKQTTMQPVLSTRLVAQSFQTALDTMIALRARLPENKRYGLCFCICQEENVSVCDMDLEIGCFVEAHEHAPVALSKQIKLHYRYLPAVEHIATSVVTGPLERILVGYAQIGKWAELNGYRTLGMPREVTLQLPKIADASDLITEVQFAVERAPAER